MSESATKLVDELKDDFKAQLFGAEIDFPAKYEAAINVVGAVPFLSEVFLRFGDATLSRWLINLIFVWKDLPFSAWKEILRRICLDATAVYHFVLFASEYLAVDVLQMIREDPVLSQRARVLVEADFPHGGPRPGSEWIREVLEQNGVDSHQLWRRLAAEGAPMGVEPSKLSPRD